MSYFSFFTLCALLLMHPIILYGPFSKYWTLFIPIQPFILNVKFYIHVNSPAWADENQIKCEKVRFLSEMSKVKWRLVFFNLQLNIYSFNWKITRIPCLSHNQLSQRYSLDVSHRDESLFLQIKKNKNLNGCLQNNCINVWNSKKIASNFKYKKQVFTYKVVWI